MPALKATLATLAVCGFFAGLIALDTACKNGNEVALTIFAGLEFVFLALIIAATWYVFYSIFKELW